ncbi:hypothetical protein RRG08_064587 [Elysia crispata]|uniref:Uncharacterized protein n=1 Tax=Elysia crispata TaxID=231223 RepID=A0AAE1B9H6_9GAST|nr:hypothetical protein RRG08_064587 [Elysia crispata]
MMVESATRGSESDAVPDSRTILWHKDRGSESDAVPGIIDLGFLWSRTPERFSGTKIVAPGFRELKRPFWSEYSQKPEVGFSREAYIFYSCKSLTSIIKADDIWNSYPEEPLYREQTVGPKEALDSSSYATSLTKSLNL